MCLYPKEEYLNSLDKAKLCQDSSFYYNSTPETILPFFDKYPIQGIKSLDFEDFKKVCLIVKSKKHLTPDGIKTILEIKSNMTKNRIF